MISISTTTSNVNGSVIINEFSGSDIYNSTKRGYRAKTLDGGVSLVNSGFADGDMTLRIRARLTKEKEEILKDIHEDETLVVISTKEGCYDGAIQSLKKLHGEINMSILLREKLSA